MVTPPSTEERVVTRLVVSSPIVLTLEVAPSSMELLWVVLPPSSSSRMLAVVVGKVVTVVASPPLSTSSSGPSDGVAPVSPMVSMVTSV